MVLQCQFYFQTLVSKETKNKVKPSKAVPRRDSPSWTDAVTHAPPPSRLGRVPSWKHAARPTWSRSCLHLALERNWTLARERDLHTPSQAKNRMSSACMYPHRVMKKQLLEGTAARRDLTGDSGKEAQGRRYLMFRTTLLQWLVLISPSACSSCCTRCSRVAGSVCRTCVLRPPF